MMLVGCGSKEDVKVFNESAADKWAGTYAISSMMINGNSTSKVTGSCTIMLAHIEGIKYRHESKFDCMIETLPLVLRQTAIVNIDNTGIVSLVEMIESSEEENDEKVKPKKIVSPTAYTVSASDETTALVFQFKKQ